MRSCSAFIALWFASLGLVSAKAEDPPKSLDPRLKVELFAEHPQIVTPTGLDVDHRGRVFAIESNTHFPPEGYKGHPTDRVLVMSDSDNDGKADKIVVFTDGLKFSMSVVVRPLWFPVAGTKEQPAPKQSVYIATRAEIFQFHDDDGDDKADSKESIVRLDTKGNYPHNGLAGFAIDALGWMYFGFGENLGADYKIIGSDGTTLSGGGEGGNIYRCRLDGSKLSIIATGFWNPHANCFDAFGRLFSVDNDPDSRPPCRLLHVIPGGDYGYKFRNGRKGLHPFTSWNGEIPGTLPMVAGTGEAPSGILAYESDGLPEEYLGNLLVTSWGDHRIDRFRLQPKGTSFTSLPEPLITGGENFRPVGIATAPDGSLFCTDWVLRDYKLHGHGRIWRVSTNEKRNTPVVPLDSLQAISVQRESMAVTLEKLNALLYSKNRDVRRMAAHVLESSKKDFPRDSSRTENPLRNARHDIEILWRFKRLVRQEPGTMPLDYQIVDHDDPFRGWLASTPGVSGNFPRAGVKYSKQALMDLATSRDRSPEPLGPSVLPFVTLNLQISDADEFFRVAASVDDPFIFATIVSWASRRLKQDDFARYLITNNTPDVKPRAPRLRQAMLLAAWKQAPKEDRLLRAALADPDSDVRRLAVQWAAEEKLVGLKPDVEAIFNSKSVTPELFLATLAALEMLDGKKPEDFDKTPAGQYVVPLLKDEKRSPAVRVQALRLVSPTDKSLNAALFENLLKSDDESLRLEAVRTLQFSQLDEAGAMLAKVATSSTGENGAQRQLVSEAILGLAAVANRNGSEHLASQALRGLLKTNSNVRTDVVRSLRQVAQKDEQTRKAIAESLSQGTGDAGAQTELGQQIHLAFPADSSDLKALRDEWTKRPNTTVEWKQGLKAAQADDAKTQKENGAVAADSGRRVFYHPNSAGCFKCHTVHGRGGKIGPDLSTIARSMSREKLIDSILEPSREIAPQFVAWTIETKDGRTISGMIVHENEGKTIIGDAEGKLTEVKTIDIEVRTPQKTSVMPEKLVERMTLQEIRDLLAFLESLK